MRIKCPIKRNNLEAMRIRAIKARKSGMTVEGIAKMIGVHRGSVSRWLTKYNRDGAKGIRSKRSSGRPKKVDCGELAPKLTKILQRPATKYQFENSLWTLARVEKVLKTELGYKLSRSTIWRSLRDIGFSCQKPERRALEQDPIARRHWMTHEWPKIRQRAKKQRAVIFFEDESTVSLTPTVGRTWARIGLTPVIRVTGNRGSVNVISAVSLGGKLLFKVPKGNVNSDEFINFLKQILREVPRKRILMVLDRGPSHRSKKVASFVESTGRLELHFLPTYSPELNPDEYVWERLKKVELKAHGLKNRTELRSKTIGKMRGMQSKKALLKSFSQRVYVT